jgi:YidC/Oxa1 family membrane protein insertase
MEQRNLILAIMASIVILVGTQFLYPMFYPAPPPQPVSQTAPSETSAPTPAVPLETAVATLKERGAALAEGPRVKIDSPFVTGSIALTGGRLDDLVLARYRETAKPDSKNIVLLSPEGVADAYYADFGWLAAEGASVPLPDPQSVWTADTDTLAPGRPVTLTWDNGAGLRFSRSFAIEDTYLFTVTQRVENTGGTATTLHPYGLISRTGTPKTLGYYILHEGLLGVLDGTLREVKYGDVKEAEGGREAFSGTGGWLGMTDKYWLVALVPDQKEAIEAEFTHALRQDIDLYHADYSGAALDLPPGGAVESTARLFAGAKEVRLLDRYRDQLGIALFDRGVDFGWFYFLTKPIFYSLDYLNRAIGNFGIAILLLTVGIRILLYPLANKSFRAMNRMKLLAPEMAKLRERFKDDRVRLQQETMALYKREKVNPAAGCLPVLVQIPVFFCLYKVLFTTIEMRHAPFFGWIRDLSGLDPTSILNLFGLAPWAVPDLGPAQFLNIGVWPIIMGLTMFVQQKLNPPPPDPVQARIFGMLPIVFTFMLAKFPAGLVIYWAWNNTLSIAQQRYIMWRMAAKS